MPDGPIEELGPFYLSISTPEADVGHMGWLRGAWSVAHHQHPWSHSLNSTFEQEQENILQSAVQGCPYVCAPAINDLGTHLPHILPSLARSAALLFQEAPQHVTSRFPSATMLTLQGAVFIVVSAYMKHEHSTESVMTITEPYAGPV